MLRTKKTNQFQLQAYEHISIAFSYQHFVNLSAYLRDSSEIGWQERFGPGKVLTDNRQQRKWSSSGKNSSIFCSRNLIDFCSWDITVFEQNWKIILFLRIKSGPGPQKDCRLKDWNTDICCENSLRAIHSDFRSSFVSHLNTAVFQIKSYFTISFRSLTEVPGPAWSLQGAQSHLQGGGSAHLVPVLHHLCCQGRRLLLQTQTSSTARVPMQPAETDFSRLLQSCELLKLHVTASHWSKTSGLIHL